VRLVRRQPAWLAVAGAALFGTAWLQLSLSNRTPTFVSWTRPALVLAVAVAVGGVAVALLWRRWSLLVGALAIGMVGLLITPAAWAANEVSSATLNATLPQAGPRTGAAARTFGSSAFDANAQMAAFLKSANTGEKWDLVTTSAQSASDLIATYDLSVMALGGFLGQDPAATVASTADKVAAGEVRYFLVSGGGPGGGFGGGQVPGGGGQVPGAGAGGPAGGFTPPAGFTPPTGGFPGGRGGFGGGPGGFGGGGTASGIMTAVRSACTPVTNASTNGALPASLDGQIYDCAGQADALRATG
jgi:hypothetical protein